ncbi:unnamed protein product [Laminaria digitata]
MNAGKAQEVDNRARCLFSGAQVRQVLDAMAARIAADLKDENPLLLCVMTGGIVTTSELALRLPFPLQIDYAHASRYGDRTVGADLHWFREPQLSLAGRQVLVVDDIFDQGATLAGIARRCEELGAAEVRLAVLVDKLHDRKLTDMRPQYVGLTVGDEYVYGFGMDYRGYLRNADGIYAVHPDDA